MAAVVIPPEQAPSTLTEGACDPAGDGEGLLGLLDVAQEVPLALLGAGLRQLIANTCCPCETACSIRLRPGARSRM